MVLQLTKIVDPRDELEKANRDELFRFAQAKGVNEITEQMFMGANAAILMRKVLRSKGISAMQLPPRQLGQPYGAIEAEPSGKSMTVDEMVEMDAQKPPEVNDRRPAVDVKSMSIQEMRKECRSRGIKLERTDNIARLREKLGG